MGEDHCYENSAVFLPPDNNAAPLPCPHLPSIEMEIKWLRTRWVQASDTLLLTIHLFTLLSSANFQRK